MNILTDEEIYKFIPKEGSTMEFARMIEAAIMSKLEEQDVGPSCWMTPDGEGWRMRTEPPVNDVPLGWMAMYQETQLIAAQQRTAEACVKVCEAFRAEDGDGQHREWYAGIDMCIDAIRNGEWREYL